MQAIHSREPVVLDPTQWARWLGETEALAVPLMRPSEAGVLAWHRVGTEVNSNRAEGPGLVVPLAA